MRKIVMMFLLVGALAVWSVGTAGAVEIITKDMIQKEILTEVDFIKNADNDGNAAFCSNYKCYKEDG